MAKYVTFSFKEKAKGLIPYSVEWEALLRQDMAERKRKSKAALKRGWQQDFRRGHPGYAKEIYARTKAVRLAYWKAYRKERPDKILARERAYRIRKRKEIAARRKRHYDKNREKILAGKRLYWKLHPEQHLSWPERKRRRERNKGA